MGSQNSTWIRHSLEGGWATNYGPTVDLAPGQDGVLRIPFLLEAENVDYIYPRGIRKSGGTARVNSSDIVSSSTTITGLYDYWRQGTGGTPTRRRVCHAGTTIQADTDDKVFASIATGLESGAIPHYSTFDDFLIIGSSSTVDVPKSWDQTTFQNLAGSPPRFSFSTPHKNRQWAAGVYTAPSTLYYSANVNPEDWTGAGSGSIDIDPNDGDMITGIASYKNELIVFKGPYKGSIHRITGSAPSDFARAVFVRGLGATWQNSIVTYGDDLLWQWSTGSVHSLKATNAFGDYNQAFLTAPIDNWIRTYLNKSRLKFTWAVNDSVNSRVVFGTSRDCIQYNDIILTYDYRFKDAPFDIGRWALRTNTTAASVGYFLEGGGGQRRVYVGATNGRIRRIDEIARTIDGSTAYTARATLPTCNYGSAWMKKTLEGLGINQVPKGNYNATIGWTRDGLTQQTTTASLSGGNVLGTDFTWGSSVWGGNRYTSAFAGMTEDGGEFRGVQYQLSQGGSDQDMEVLDLHAKVIPGGESISVEG